VPAASHLKDDGPENVRVVFASGIEKLNRAMLEHFAARDRGLPLFVVAEFDLSVGTWIPWHVHRTTEQNLGFVRTALAGKRIASAAVAFDRRSGLGDLCEAARKLAPGVLMAYDEEMRVAPPDGLHGFLFRRRARSVIRQLRTGGRARAWLRRIAHPGEAEIPLRARLAQARGLTAVRRRAASPFMNLPAPAGLKSGVSVIIPSRDGLQLLLKTMLPALLSQLPNEVIVVDNGSSDGTARYLAVEYPEIRVLQHVTPLSFARAVNAGIRESRFTHTLLLNNDMIVEAGFVQALKDAFLRVPELFCATAQILFPAGLRREETGKAVWRRQTPGDFPVRCDVPVPGEDLTWVLYGSGGCSMFDTARLARLGVSELYDPAYVEDLDLGFRAWQQGWPSVYCAQARVEHRHRGTTSRFYTEREIAFFVERNYLRFVANAISEPSLFQELWLEGVRRLQLLAMQNRMAALDTLRAIPPIGPLPAAPQGHLRETEILALTSGDVAVFSGQRQGERAKVLVASPYLPFPLSHGGAVRIFNLMKLVSEANDLILVAFADELAPPPGELLSICSQIVLVRRHGTHYRMETERPDVVEEFESATFRACLKQAVHQWQPAIAQLEFTWMAQYANSCRPAKTVLIEHDVTFDLQQQLLETAARGTIARLELEQQLAKWRAFETSAWSNVDCVVTMSAKDTGMIQGARMVECLPNGVDCQRFQPAGTEPEPHRLLLIGSFAHLPNLLALEFFLREVWPLLGPGYKLHVIGGARHDYYLDFFRDRVSPDLTRTGVEVEGFVADVRPAYERAQIVLAPLTASAGTNIKVLEAMAMGKVVVSTPAGVNGIDVQPDDDFILTETGRQMADQITRIAGDAARRLEVERNAREAALRFDWRAIAKRQQALYEKLRSAYSDPA
jgi:GT2 family glycosyltransferase/glycosyltransferase involved in cell wall biosynthesis